MKIKQNILRILERQLVSSGIIEEMVNWLSFNFIDGDTYNLTEEDKEKLCEVVRLLWEVQSDISTRIRFTEKALSGTD